MQMKDPFDFKPCPNCGSKPEISFEVIHTPRGEVEGIGLYGVCKMCGRRTRTHWDSDGIVNEWNGGFNGCSIRR